MRGSVLIVAPYSDLHAAGVFHQLQEMGTPVRWLAFQESRPPLVSYCLCDAADGSLALQYRGSDLDHEFKESDPPIRVVWWRRPGRTLTLESTDPVARNFVQSEWRHFIFSLADVLANAFWVNPPDANVRAGRKLRQLSIAKRVGFITPNTLATNDPGAALEFVRAHKAVIYKRIGDAQRPLTATLRFGDEERKRIADLVNCPALFQEEVDAAHDLRVTVFGSEISCVKIHSQQGASKIDWRFDHTVQFEPTDLPDEIKEKIYKMMKILGLRYSAFDFRQRQDGAVVFLETNPMGQFLFIDLKCTTSITERFSRYISGILSSCTN